MDWSNLGEGLAGMVAQRLLSGDVADYVRFRAVCRSWRHCPADPRAHGILDRRFHPRRWIMLREKVADPERRCRLLNVSTGQCVRAHLPELRGHDVCAPTVEGLLVLLNRTTYAVRLLNPLTRHVSDLPPATTLYPLYRGEYSAGPRLNFEVSGAGLADEATVAVLFEEVQMLVVAKLGDEQWTLVKQGMPFSPAISFAGRFYCTTNMKIKMVDTSDNQPPRLVVAAKIAHLFSRAEGSMHLLDNDGELMLLSRTLMQKVGEARYFMEYKVSRVDLDARKTRPIPDLGGRAVFIGSTCAISVSPLAFPAIRNDSVYLGKDHKVGYNLENTGPYKLVDGTGTTPSFDEGSGVTQGCGYDNNGRRIVCRYEPRSIVDYLSLYVTKDTSISYAEEDTSDSDAEAN